MKRILFIGIRMDRGGTEQALLSLLSSLDPKRFSASLLLAEHKGAWMDRIPKTVRLLPPLRNGVLFTLSRHNVLSVISKLRFRGKTRFLMHSGERIRDMVRCKPGAVERFFIELMKASCYQFSEEYPNEEFDAVFAFSGDRTMFYLCEKICCQRKYVVQHFDFRFPKRDENVYHFYFSRCDGVISVSQCCTNLLKQTFPDLEANFKTFYNVIDPVEIQRLSQIGAGLPPKQDGTFRILSVMRICRQKGAELIPYILKNLKNKGYSVDWYLIGDGRVADIARLTKEVMNLGVASMFHYLGSVDNPYAAMRDCDLFVLPTRYEGMPLVIEEGKILQTPVVTTDYLSANEQLHDGDLGVIVPCSTETLAEAIETLISDPHMLKIYKERLSQHQPVFRDINREMDDLLYNSDNCE